MRYGLQWADPDAVFPQDTFVGAQLVPEEPIVVPPECPECPPASECEVLCVGWGYVITQDAGFVYTVSGFTSDTSPTLGVPNAAARGGSAALFPGGQFCGHRLRFMTTPTGLTEGTDYTKSIIANISGNYVLGLMLLFGTAITTGSVLIQAQIDLTDAEPGSETWTDICTPLTIAPNAGH